MSTPLVAPENDYSSLSGFRSPVASLHVAVVIPVYNRVSLLTRTLAGLRTQTYPRDLLSVVVADDGSDEDVIAAVEQNAGDIPFQVVRRGHDGYGAGQARNLGASEAVTDILVFLDADCVPDREAVSNHAVWHHLADNLVVIGSRHHIDTSAIDPVQINTDPTSLRLSAFGSDNPERDAWVSDDFRSTLHRRSSSLRHGDQAFRSLVSSNFSIRKDRFLTANGFSEDFTRWGGEDTELGWRLWNEGMFFVDEPKAAIYHQTQEDEGAAGWRGEGRRANDGLIQAKIPHRFYRTPIAGLNETPKVSVVIHSVEDNHLPELADQTLAQRLSDIEIVLTGASSAITEFSERRHGDPRFLSAPNPEQAVRTASGEFVAFVHGSAALDHRLLSRSVSAIENKPRTGWVRSAYGVPTTEGTDIFRRTVDLDAIDTLWGDALPVFALTRRRDLMKSLNAGDSVASAWMWVKENNPEITHGTALVLLPAHSPADPRPESLNPPSSMRSMLISDLKSGGLGAIKAPLRAVRSKATGTPYQATPVAPTRVEGVSSARPSIRYVGWTGRSNMGDEAMLDAVRQLFPESDVVTEASKSDLLMLGGGTLINRGYLRHLRPLDSPKIERVVFGTGVANPEYWTDPKEAPAEWVRFLETCVYLGVRGPLSRETLFGWGLDRQVEIVGDPALSLQPSPEAATVEGRVVVCPAFTRGLLWGESDEDVFSAYARTIRNLTDEGHDVWALSASPRDDRYILEMMREADAPEMPYLAGHEDPQAAIDLLASAELAIAERLHGAVLAAAAGTLPVMVEYRPKLRDFAASLGLDDLIIRTDRLAGNALTDLARESLGRGTELMLDVRDLVDKYRMRQRNAAEKILEAIR